MPPPRIELKDAAEVAPPSPPVELDVPPPAPPTPAEVLEAVALDEAGPAPVVALLEVPDGGKDTGEK